MRYVDKDKEIDDNVTFDDVCLNDFYILSLTTGDKVSSHSLTLMETSLTNFKR